VRRLRAALLIVGVPWLIAGCELIANIQDLQGGSAFATDGAPASTSNTTYTSSGSNTITISISTSTGTSSARDAATSEASQDDASLDATMTAPDAADAGDATVDAQDGSTADSSDAPLTVDGADGSLRIELIDDLESQSGHIPAISGRAGSWFTYNDGLDGGTQTPAPTAASFVPASTTPPLGNSSYSARTSGNCLKYAGMGFTLNDPPSTGVRTTYNGTAYIGVTFWARVGAGSATQVRFNVLDRNTDPAGGVCTVDGGVCSDYLGALLTLTTSWTQQTLYFSSLHQQNFGVPPESSLDTAHLYGMNFQVNGNVTFDVWVDNVYFILP
jgi:hypothetical protein